MKTKRIFFALMATLLLPLTVMAQDVAPTPAPGTAVIAVSVFFDNGNIGDPVKVNLQCTGGTITPSGAYVINPQNGEYQHAFVVESIPLVPEADEPGVECWVTQDPLDGYDTYYNCLYGPYSGLTDANPDPACSAGFTQTNVCHWTDVQPNDAGGCTIGNYVEYQPVKVTKKWDISGTGGDNTNRGAEIAISCNTPITGGTYSGGKWTVYRSLGNNDYNADGVAVVSAMVFPRWYPEDSSQGNFCSADEYDVDSSVEVESDCGSYGAPGMEVFVGSGDSCTITNTVFFEGIPTLNQYGMAIMALLMLGVGFVGFRRFV